MVKRQSIWRIWWTLCPLVLIHWAVHLPQADNVPTSTEPLAVTQLASDTPVKMCSAQHLNSLWTSNSPETCLFWAFAFSKVLFGFTYSTYSTFPSGKFMHSDFVPLVWPHMLIHYRFSGTVHVSVGQHVPWLWTSFFSNFGHMTSCRNYLYQLFLSCMHNW